MTKKVACLFPLLMLFLLLPFVDAQGESASEAQPLTQTCTFSATGDQQHIPRMMDDRYDRYWDGTGASLTVTLPENVACQGMSLSFFGDAVPLILETRDAAGQWQTAAEYQERFINAFIPLNATGEFRLTARNKSDTLKISKLTIWGEGTLPKRVQRWQTLDGDAELMLIATHPDDDLIWFGGLLPTYAGQKGRRVMVVYVAGEPSPRRRNELLDGLWTCGVTDYPEIGPFMDLNGKSIQVVESKWGGKDAVSTYLTKLLRKYRPQVIVSQAIKGEYGHSQHIVAVQAVIDSVTAYSADAAFDASSAQEYGVYTPKKLYLHMWRENELVFDWNQPLSAFDGKTGCEVATEAFKMHVSQAKTHYHIYMSGPYDSQRLGLYWSSVGLDEAKNDVFEHCDARHED